MPLLWISLSFGLGLAAAAFLGGPAAEWLALCAASLALLPAARLRGHFWAARALRAIACPQAQLLAAPALLAAAFFFGGWRMAASAPDLASGHIAAINDTGSFRITAVVDAPPDARDRSTLLRLRVISWAALTQDGGLGVEQPSHGFLLAVLPPGQPRAYGDLLTLEGSPVTPPENEEFSYRDYLARQGIYSYMAYPRARLLERGTGSPLLAAVYRVRDWALKAVLRLFPSPEGPLLAGILLGVESGIPEGLKRAYQDTGTAHVIAISGFNIAILAELFSRLFGKIFSRGWALLAAVAAIIGYTLLVGASPSVVRAAVMGSMSLLAAWLGRRSTAANSLAFTGLVMCLHNPHLPWDVSFQLSFGATLGLILYGERFQRGLERLLERRLAVETARRIAAPAGEYLLMTLAAQIMTLPIVLFHFQRLSLSALITNPLILPVQPLVMLMSGAAVLLSAVSEPAAQAAAWLAWPFSAYTNRVVELMARIPGGVLVTGEIGLGTTALMYAAVTTPLVIPRLSTRLKEAATPMLLSTAALLLAALLWRGASSLPDGRLHLLVMNQEGTQVVLIRAPSGETALVNGGASTRALDDALGRRFSPFDHQIDALILSDAKAGAIGALPGLLDRYPVRSAVWAVSPPDTRSANQLVSALDKHGASTEAFSQGASLRLGDAQVTVLAANEASAALLVRMGGFRALLPGSFSPEELTPGLDEPVSALLLGAQEPQENAFQRWQERAPQVSITNASSALPQDLPGGVVIQPGGWVSIITDGERMWIERQ